MREQRYPNLPYALIDINGDGQDELFLRSEEILHNYGSQVDENRFMAAIGEKDGTPTFLQGDIIEILSTVEGEEKHHGSCRFDTDYRQERN